jgi:hypothetical protein
MKIKELPEMNWQFSRGLFDIVKKLRTMVIYINWVEISELIWQFKSAYALLHEDYV